MTFAPAGVCALWALALAASPTTAVAAIGGTVLVLITLVWEVGDAR